MSSRFKSEVTLTAEQADLCRAILCPELIKISRTLASGKDEHARKLTQKSKRELSSYSTRVQLVLIALGMTARQLEKIVTHLGS
jgi:hypothetical protein